MATIKKIKPKSPDPYIGKTKGDNEFARLAHLNNVVDQINSADFGTGGGIAVNSSTSIGKLVFDSTQFTSIPDLFTTPTEMTISLTGPKVYRAKLFESTLDYWPGFGYLYNWFAASDVRNIANPDGGSGQSSPYEWKVPNSMDHFLPLKLLAQNLNPGHPSSVLKSNLQVDTSLKYHNYRSDIYGWYPGEQGNNDFNFNFVPACFRSEVGNFGLTVVGYQPGPYSNYAGILWARDQYTSTEAYSMGIDKTDFIYSGTYNKGYGLSVRVVRDATPSELLLTDGTTSDGGDIPVYISNNGGTYQTVKIGSHIWITRNLTETQFSDGSYIQNASTNGGDPSNLLWTSLASNESPAYTNLTYSIYDLTVVAPYNYDINVPKIRSVVLENSLGTDILWSGDKVGAGLQAYIATRADSTRWYPSHINITPTHQGYLTGDFTETGMIPIYGLGGFDGSVFISFAPYARTSNGVVSIDNFNNDFGSNSGVYIEILEYQPAPTPPYYLGSGGVGVNNI